MRISNVSGLNEEIKKETKQKNHKVRGTVAWDLRSGGCDLAEHAGASALLLWRGLLGLLGLSWGCGSGACWAVLGLRSSSRSSGRS